MFVFESFGDCGRCGDEDMLSPDDLCSSCQEEVDNGAAEFLGADQMEDFEIMAQAQRFASMLLEAFAGCQAYAASVKVTDVGKGFRQVKFEFALLVDGGGDGGRGKDGRRDWVPT